MKTCSVSEAKSSLGRLADEALKGRPSVIVRSGKLLILQAYDPPNPDEFDALIDEGIASEHVSLTDSFWDGVRARGRKLARKLAVRRQCGSRQVLSPRLGAFGESRFTTCAVGH